MSEIVFEIDERPLGFGLPSPSDYMGRLVLSALHEPLLRPGSKVGAFVPGAASRWEVEPGGLGIVFELDPTRGFAHGAAVTPEAVIRAISQASRHPYWKQLLWPLRAVQAEGSQRVQLALRRPAGHLLSVLSAVDLSPQAPDASSPTGLAFNGPWRLLELGADGSCRAEPQPFHPGAAQRPSLRFRVQREPTLSPGLFERGEVHVTCNTAFPFAALGAWSHAPVFRAGDSGIFMQLELGPEAVPVLADARARRALSLAIDRAALAASLSGGVAPADHLGPCCFPGITDAHRVPFAPEEAVALARTSGLEGQRLRVAYNAYFPNAEVLEEVGRQWRQFLGVTLELVRAPFERPELPSHDLALRLRYPAYVHPASALDSYLAAAVALRALEGPEALTRLVLSAHDAEPEAAASAVRTALGRFTELSLAIPLCHIRSLYLMRREVRGFSYPDHAAFDLTSLTWQEP